MKEFTEAEIDQLQESIAQEAYEELQRLNNRSWLRKKADAVRDFFFTIKDQACTVEYHPGYDVTPGYSGQLRRNGYYYVRVRGFYSGDDVVCHREYLYTLWTGKNRFMAMLACCISRMLIKPLIYPRKLHIK